MHPHWRFTSLPEQSRYSFLFFSPALGNFDFYRYIAHPYIIWCDFTVTDRTEQLSFFFAGLTFSNLSALRISCPRRGRRIFTAFPSIMDTQLSYANGNDCGFIFAPFSLVGRVGRMKGKGIWPLDRRPWQLRL